MLTGKDGTRNHSSINTHWFPALGDGPSSLEKMDHRYLVCSNHLHAYALFNKNFNYQYFRLQKLGE